MRWPDKLQRYACLNETVSTSTTQYRVWVFVETGAAYCPRCGNALADFRHEFAGAGSVSIEDSGTGAK